MREDEQAANTLLWFLSELWKLTSVKKTAWSTAVDRADLWVMLEKDDFPDQERIYLLEREYRRTGYLPIDVHVISLERVAEENLPQTTLLFAR